MEFNEIRDKLNRWSFPHGPFREMSEIFQEMEMMSRCTGAEVAPKLVTTLVLLEQAMDPLEEALYQFLQVYAKFYPKALEEALLQELTPTGPPALIEILGHIGSKRALRQLGKVLALDEADDDLLESLACALGELGGIEAKQMLYILRGRTNLSLSVHNEINIALANLRTREAEGVAPKSGVNDMIPLTLVTSKTNNTPSVALLRESSHLAAVSLTN